jgi:hypothetical protein
MARGGVDGGAQPPAQGSDGRCAERQNVLLSLGITGFLRVRLVVI